MTSSSTTTGTPADTTAGGVWVSITQAGAILNLTERSVRRGIASGKYVTAIRDGKRVIRIEGEPAASSGGNRGGQPAGGGIVELKPATTNTTGTELLAVRQAVELIAEPIRAELVRTRRAARWGWSMTAAAGILLAVGSIWGVRAVEQARGQAIAAEGVRGILAEQLGREQRRADELAGELHRVRREQAIAGAVELLDSIP